MSYIFLIILITISYFLLKKFTKNETYNPPPGPKGLPIIGNLHQLDIQALYVNLFKLGTRYGPVMSLKLGFERIVVIQSAEAAKEVLKIQDINFCDKAPRVGLLKMSYNGLEMAFGPYGDICKQVKKLTISNLLSPKRVQEASVIRQEEVSRLINKIFTISSKNEIVDLSDLLMSYSCNNVCMMAFGKRCDDDGTTKKIFHDLLEEAEAIFTTFYFADYFPGGSVLDKVTGISSKLEKIFMRLDAFYEKIINDHLDPNRKSCEDDFIDFLLRLHQENSFPFEFTMDHMKALIMNIFVAGSGTTAIMLVWAMTELIKSPKALMRAQDELRAETRPNGFTVDDDLSQFEYFMGVIKEILRLHPAAPILIARDTKEKCSILGYDVLPKTIVMVNVWAIARDPKAWNDPEKFMPERFIGSALSYKGQDFEYLPFGGGRRICPGMHLGSANMIVTLANLLYCFNWDVPAGTKREDIDLECKPGISKHKKNPLCLVASKFVH